VFLNSLTISSALEAAAQDRDISRDLVLGKEKLRLCPALSVSGRRQTGNCVFDGALLSNLPVFGGFLPLQGRAAPSKGFAALQAPPMWRDKAFVGQFGDCFVQDTELEGGHIGPSLGVLARVLGDLVSSESKEAINYGWSEAEQKALVEVRNRFLPRKLWQKIFNASNYLLW